MRQSKKYPITFYCFVALFGLVYGLISLVNHYNFRTYGWDLGINNNAIFDYAHFRWNDCTIMGDPQFENILSDHFTVLPLIVSPFYWLFGSYTMLIFQIVGLIWGGIGVYRVILDKTEKEFLALCGQFHFYAIWGVYSALSFDYHDNVMAATFVPWFLYYFNRKNWWGIGVYFVLILISKENMALWAIFIGLGLAWLNFKDRIALRNALVISVISGLYFIVVVKLVIPGLGNAGREYLHLKYSALGASFSEVLMTMVTRPWYTIKLLFVNHSNDSSLDLLKLQTHLVILFSGGVVLLFRPQYLVMLLPIFAQKLFNDSSGKWGLGAQYSIEYAPILAIGLYLWLDEQFRRDKLKKGFALAFAFMTLITTGVVMEKRIPSWYNSVGVAFYSKKHYEREFDVSYVHQALDEIPVDAKVSAQSFLAPHVAFREFIYHYPHVKDADYIVLAPAVRGTYPLSRKAYESEIRKLRDSKDWEIKADQGGFLMFKRVTSSF